MHKETKLRSIVKTVSWRFLATATTVSLVLIFTGEVTIAVTVGAFEIVAKLIIYFLHERFWGRIHWGKREARPFVVWITGLSGCGKTSIAQEVAEMLRGKGIKTDHLDGRTIRELFPETGFSKEEVNEHIKRVGYLAQRLEKSGVCVVASFISPYRESRDFVRRVCDNFMEVHLATPAEVCEQRDTRDLYRRARRGIVKNLPGVDVAYEENPEAELVLDTTDIGIQESAERIILLLRQFWQ